MNGSYHEMIAARSALAAILHGATASCSGSEYFILARRTPLAPGHTDVALGPRVWILGFGVKSGKRRPRTDLINYQSRKALGNGMR